MFNLAFHGSHNSTIALSCEDKILECVEIERLISKKNAALFYYENPDNRVEIIKKVLTYFEKKYGCHEYDNLIINSVDTDKIDLKSILNFNRLIYMPHHEAHSNNVMYQSPYQRSLVVSFDGGSDQKFFNVFIGDKSQGLTHLYSGKRDYAISYMTPAHFIRDIKKENNIYVGNLVYSGKLMGYVGYGKVREDLVEKLVEFYESNTYDIIPHAINRFISLFSEYGINDWNSKFSDQDGKDVAASNQLVFERLFRMEINNFLIQYPNLPLLITGGCALNIINNTKLLKSRDVFVSPNPSDVGLAVGMLCGLLKPKDIVDTTYIGPYVWDEDELPNYLVGRKYENLNVKRVALDIVNGNIIGVVRGRSEHGPRALGNRSIICDATNPEMKDYLNKEIKNRESFRPFSPVVRYEDIQKYFEFEEEIRWMTFSPKVKEEKKELLSSVIHIDGTSRVQTVTRGQNQFLYDLLTEIDKLNGNGIVLNTSFNIAGNPILNTLKESFWMFDHKNLGGLVINKTYVYK